MTSPDIRKIIHVDMDAFFAAVEQRDHPHLRGRPVAVGRRGRRGVVAAASYEARVYGVHSAMPSFIAEQKCPELIFVPHRFEVYREISRLIQGIFHDYTDLVEPLSLDEAYLDVTRNKRGLPSATLIAREIKSRIRARTSLTASAGVSFNKFLAKIASDLDKPDGLYVITPEEAPRFLEELPVEEFHGVGKKTAEKMRRYGIATGADLKALGEMELVRMFGKAGLHYYRVVRGLDDRPVQPHRIRKSIGAEETFGHDVGDEYEMWDKLGAIMDDVWGRLEKKRARGATVTLKLKYDNFEQHTRSRTLEHLVRDREELGEVVYGLLRTPFLPERAVRLLGVTLSNLKWLDTPEEAGQLTLDL